MLSIRVFAELFEADVEWDKENRCVLFQYGTRSEPESSEVDQPGESDESEKETNYNMALYKLKSGYSYEAYHGFKALGDYKNREYYRDIAYWLNRAILFD